MPDRPHPRPDAHPGGGNFNFSEIAAASQAGKLAMFVDGTSIVAQSLDANKSQVIEHMAHARIERLGREMNALQKELRALRRKI